jgi:hypothetical protein
MWAFGGNLYRIKSSGASGKELNGSDAEYFRESVMSVNAIDIFGSWNELAWRWGRYSSTWLNENQWVKQDRNGLIYRLTVIWHQNSIITLPMDT